MRLAAMALSLLLCVLLGEVGARAYWRMHYGVLDASRVLYAYYPGLHSIDQASPSREDHYYDVLLLGASSLNRNWGEVEPQLVAQLDARGRRNVRVFNLAQHAQTSRDSLLKYAAVGDARFELVVLYDGINEARANNAPPDVFAEDYGHYSWYRIVNALAPYHRTARIALPYTLRFLAVEAGIWLDSDRIVPAHEPNKAWLRYGADIRTAASFEHNLEAILEIAGQRGDPVLLATFATYVPSNYSLEAFEARRLDYGFGGYPSPIELWGEKDHVTAAVAAHNEVVRKVAARHPDVLFVDAASKMDGVAAFFDDVCHFTPAGATALAANLVGALPPASAPH